MHFPEDNQNSALLGIPTVFDRSCTADNFHEQTPLQLAAEFGTLEVVQYMIEKGVKSEGLCDAKYSLLHFAAYGGKLNIVKYLIQAEGYNSRSKDRNGKTPLHSACASGQLHIIKFLLDVHKVNISCHDNTTHTSPLDVAAQYRQLHVVRHLTEEKKCKIEHSPDDFHYSIDKYFHYTDQETNY